jgi:predicted transcriptional regulator
MMVGSNSSSRNVYEVVDDNSNPYRSMIMDVMRMNQGYAGECSIIDEEPDTNTTRFFYRLKDFDESLWDECTNYSKLSIVEHVFTIKSDYGLNKVGYKKIIEYARNILLKGNRLKENFYTIKSMMKPLGLEYQNTKSYIRKLLDKYVEKGENTRMILVSVIEKRGI